MKEVNEITTAPHPVLISRGHTSKQMCWLREAPAGLKEARKIFIRLKASVCLIVSAIRYLLSKKSSMCVCACFLLFKNMKKNI